MTIFRFLVSGPSTQYEKFVLMKADVPVSVLDEADRILDMGFAKSLNAIVSHLPKSRQTLLFSATQTDSVRDLVRLSLQDPVTISVREEAHDSFTPKNLSQHYLVCTLDKKLDLLFSFIRTHLRVKVLVFFSSCKQVSPKLQALCLLAHLLKTTGGPICL